MDWRAMLVVAVAIVLERVAPAGVRMARISGAVALGQGMVLLVRAMNLG
jgi:hypothetical protein